MRAGSNKYQKLLVIEGMMQLCVESVYEKENCEKPLNTGKTIAVTKQTTGTSRSKHLLLSSEKRFCCNKTLVRFRMRLAQECKANRVFCMGSVGLIITSIKSC